MFGVVAVYSMVSDGLTMFGATLRAAVYGQEQNICSACILDVSKWKWEMHALEFCVRTIQNTSCCLVSRLSSACARSWRGLGRTLAYDSWAVGGLSYRRGDGTSVHTGHGGILLVGVCLHACSKNGW